MMRILTTILMMTMFAGTTLAASFEEDLKEGLQEFGEGVRTGVRNAEQAIKDAPAAISKAANRIEDSIRKDDASKDDDRSEAAKSENSSEENSSEENGAQGE